MLGGRSRSASCLVLALCISAFIVPLTAAPPSYAQSPSEQVESLRRHLWIINGQLNKMESELQSWKSLLEASEARLNELNLELTGLKEELQNLQASYEISQTQVATLVESLRQSEQKLRVVSKTLTSSAESWKAVADYERARRKKARLATILGIAGALLAGGVAGYLVAK
jgi:chromosome segregation ATPase